MDAKLIETADGSHTVLLPDNQTTYHSRHGAVQESMHVFIRAGLHEIMQHQKTISIFEMGFGTGLNALLTCMEAVAHNLVVDYHSIEAHPLDTAMVESLNFGDFIAAGTKPGLLNQMHTTPSNKPALIAPGFTLTRWLGRLQDFAAPRLFDLIYFDAFAPTLQPELWTEEIFSGLKNMMAKNASLVTYCSKSQVRKNMQAAGLKVSKLPGPPGKREMIRAHHY